MADRSVELLVRGTVQGVGFRPAVWRLATGLGLGGEVRNDAAGVLIRLDGPAAAIEAFTTGLADHSPASARIDTIEQTSLPAWPASGAFRIAATRSGVMATQIAPDAAPCADCLAEMADPASRRFRYPFTNCTQCGPRFTIVESAPYDRARTTMRGFAMCPACAAEYADPADRRFHAQPIACPACGPTLTLTTLGGDTIGGEPIAAAADLVARGGILAIKGAGGFHLACDAGNADAVAELRRRKRRPGKPFAVMMPDLDAVCRHCTADAAEWAALRSREAPVVLLRMHEPLAGVAPGLGTLGVMLPSTPLHHLLMGLLARPVVMTSGNASGEPPCLDGGDARFRLAGIADAVLDHDRPIATRCDDSVVRVAGRPALLRRGRGHAPAPIRLPPGFESAPPIVAMGGELKSSFCLAADGQATLSHHLGDLEDALAFDDYRAALDRYLRLFGHTPAQCAVDLHPDYLSRKLGEARGLPLTEVQHHHAHMAACLAENGVPLDAGPVLGIVLDGLGLGDDDRLWGGEFLLGGYRSVRRVASLATVAMPGGALAAREPWRNTLAHLLTAMPWAIFEAEHAGTKLARFLAGQPARAVESLVHSGLAAPPASSCGRLFDAVAGALDLSAAVQSYEGEAAARLEAIAGDADGEAYPFEVAADNAGLPRLGAVPMWRALLADLSAGVPASTVAARFHDGLAQAVAELAKKQMHGRAEPVVALSGGCFQNRRLLETVKAGLEADGIHVLIHARVPANDGGLAFGQAAVAAARSLPATKG